MALTALDAKTALIVIDLQKGLLAYPTAHAMDGVVAKARVLVDAFRGHDLPIVFVNATGVAPGRTEQTRPRQTFVDDFAEFAPALGVRPTDHVVTKRTWGAFTATGLDAHLKGLGVTQVAVCGVATTAGVESTARQAHEHGFNVTLALDAMTDRSLEAHRHSVTHIFPKLGETGTTDEIVALLDASRR